MKISTLIIASMLGSVALADAQSTAIPAPEFKNKVYYVKKDNTLTDLDNTDLTMDMKTGMTSAKINLRAAGTAAAVKHSGLPSCRFVVKIEDGTDPEAAVELFRFETDKKSRYFQIGSVVMGSSKSVELPKQKLTFTKLQPGVYMVTSKEELPAGEYAFVLGRPAPSITGGGGAKAFAFEVGGE